MADKAKHAFGSSANLQSAIDAGKVDAFDLLFLDGDTNPKFGWVDKNGNPVIVEGGQQVVQVEELPATDGLEGVIYIYQNEAYIWDGSQCVPIAKSADLTTLETQVSTLETQMETKVDQETVTEIVEKIIEQSVGAEVVEF